MLNRAMNNDRDWSPPEKATWRPSAELSVADVIAWRHCAWGVIDVRPLDPRDGVHDRWARIMRLYGPEQEREDPGGYVEIQYASTHPPRVYRDDRVWLCSCCQHPVPCQRQVIDDETEHAAALLEELLARAVPGVCFACGDAITTRQHSVTYTGENADIPGYPGPSFHLRKSCAGARAAYVERAGYPTGVRAAPRRSPASTPPPAAP